jgi:tetratricopeptide (TPR) repeat protein
VSKNSPFEAMAQPATNPKIEELRFKIKSDPKTRLFYQLAEELRKVKAFGEAQEVLRTGLVHNPTYLAAWVSLGRVLREEDKHNDSIEAFTKALQIDPGNVVAARLMGDAYLDLGNKVEAIKKYKLCRALLPVDEDLDAMIDRLEEEINPVQVLQAPAAATPAPAPVSAPPPAAAPVAPPTPPPAPAAVEERAESTQPAVPPPPPPPPPPQETAPAPPHPPSPAPAPAPAPEPEIAAVEESPFATSEPEEPSPVATGDIEPMHVAHEQSPFEDPAPSYSAAALELEQPPGMHIESAPPQAEVSSSPWPEEDAAAEVFEPSAPSASAVTDDVANTLTMADLYVKQGFTDRAQSIYESILERDPNNDAVRTKLEDLEARPSATPELQSVAQEPVQTGKVDRLQGWLAKVKRGEAGSV